MKRLSTGVLAAVMAAGFGLNAVAAPTSASHGNIGTNAIAQGTGSTMAAPPANFGSPPSGQIPILFNDHHVYAKPDVLAKGNRVLAALVRGGTILIPLRSMFEQMGATVKYNAASKTVDVSKAGADVKVTVGKKEVVINGETRPLDVPPMMYQGHILVPVRVISEGMGAYVQWVQDRHIVVVRYVVATPPPPATPAPTEAPSATAPPTPTPAPVATPYLDKFIAGDYIISPKVYNEFNPGTTASNTNGGFSYGIRAGAEFNLFNLPWMLEGDYRQLNYPHNCSGAAGDPSCMVTGIGGNYATYVPAFTVRDYDFDARLGLKVMNPRIYIGIGYMWRGNNAGYPRMSNVGFGIEKLPDLDRPFSIYGSVWYYGNVKGTTNASYSGGTSYTLAYNVLKTQLGLSYSFANSPLFIEAGVDGESQQAKTNAPGGGSNFGAYVGLGLKF